MIQVDDVVAVTAEHEQILRNDEVEVGTSFTVFDHGLGVQVFLVHIEVLASSDEVEVVRVNSFLFIIKGFHINRTFVDGDENVVGDSENIVPETDFDGFDSHVQFLSC